MMIWYQLLMPEALDIEIKRLGAQHNLDVLGVLKQALQLLMIVMKMAENGDKVIIRYKDGHEDELVNLIGESESE